MLRCPICQQHPAQIGVLCEECRDELSGPITISPEQIAPHLTAPTLSGLVDIWGQPHRVATQTTIGRNIEDNGFAILEGSVSRRHATLSLDGTEWTLSDLGSANGTYLDDRLIDQPVPIKHGDRIRFGHIAFFFAEDVSHLPPPHVGRTPSKTTQPLAILPLTTLRFRLLPITELREVTFEFREPTGGGGGVVEIDGKQLQLTLPQFELIRLLVARMLAELEDPVDERGYVDTSELLVVLSLDSRDPSDTHIRQLVRRVRRALIKAEIGDLIESRQGLGYRLGVIPKPKA